jgi:hypothetical protein
VARDIQWHSSLQGQVESWEFTVSFDIVSDYFDWDDVWLEAWDGLKRSGIEKGSISPFWRDGQWRVLR